MGDKMMSVLLVTANIGSIFEAPEILLETWIKEFVANIKKYLPKFVAVHCQEVGGKNYESSMRHVQQFLSLLTSNNELSCYDKVRVFLDEDFTCSENFTALGNLYFIHQNISDVYLWDFKENSFAPVFEKEIYSGNIEDVSTKEKQKFPQEFFPECKWSRKGFLRTRWNFGGTIFDLVNIHLFHDASNFLAMESFPSCYSENRRRALDYTINKFMNESENQVPFFIFGDFNFRLDTQGVVNRLTQKAVPIQENGGKNCELTKIVYTESGNKDEILLSIEKKVFDYIDHTNRFMVQNGEWREFDQEFDAFLDVLHEYNINFAPSYPFSEDYNDPSTYMKTRCPAWCDRILLSKNAVNLVCSACNDDEAVHYDLMGLDVCMGDHKPVFLNFNMKIERSGTCVIVTKPSHMIRCNSANFSEAKKCPEILTNTSSHNNLLKPPTPHLRFISHHSSSCEEWYENIKIFKRQNAVDHAFDYASESDSGVAHSIEVERTKPPALLTAGQNRTSITSLKQPDKRTKCGRGKCCVIS